MAAWIPCEACGKVVVRVDPAEVPARVLCQTCATDTPYTIDLGDWLPEVLLYTNAKRELWTVRRDKVL
jgi:hypothetical protein